MIWSSYLPRIIQTRISNYIKIVFHWMNFSGLTKLVPLWLCLHSAIRIFARSLHTTTNGGEKRRTAYGRWMSRAEHNQRYIKQRIARCEERIFRCQRIKHGLDRLVPVDYDHIVCYRNIARLNVANEPYVSAIKWYMTRNLIKIGLILPIEMSFFLIFVCLHETAGSLVWDRFAGSLWPSKFGLERRLPASRS